MAALEEMLEANEKKARKDHLTVKRVWLDLARMKNHKLAE